MDKESTRRYLRLSTEGEKWTGMVAEIVQDFEAGPNNTAMYAFHDDRGNKRCIAQSEAEEITEKEYFTAVLKGAEKFND